jgi:hypothetical protein
MLISSQGYGQLAQSVEQRPEKPRVRSSILRLPTIPLFLNFQAQKNPEIRNSLHPEYAARRVHDAKSSSSEVLAEARSVAVQLSPDELIRSSGRFSAIIFRRALWGFRSAGFSVSLRQCFLVLLLRGLWFLVFFQIYFFPDILE